MSSFVMTPKKNPQNLLIQIFFFLKPEKKRNRNTQFVTPENGPSLHIYENIRIPSLLLRPYLLALILLSCELVLSAHNLCKQVGPRSGRAESGSNLFDTQVVFQKYFFEKVDFERKSADYKKA